MLVKILLAFLFSLASISNLTAQSRATGVFQEKFGTSLNLFFYKNTLRMLNQSESKEFDDLIDGIDKIKFLIIDRLESQFSNSDYDELVNNYNKEDYKLVLNGNLDGQNFEFYLQDLKNKTPKSILLYRDSTKLIILDVVGSLDITRANSLFEFINNSTDVGQLIKNIGSIEENDIDE